MKGASKGTSRWGGVHGGRVTEYAETWRLDPDQIVDFSANINPNGPPLSVQQAMMEAFPTVVHYPDARQPQVKKVLAAYHECSPEQLVVGNGATEVMELLWRWIRPNRTLVFAPAFAEYAAIAQRHGLRVEEINIPAEKWVSPANVLAVMRQVSVGPGDLVVFNNPHNPTGALFTRLQWASVVADWLEQGAWVVMDEAFLDFLPPSQQAATSAVSWVKDSQQLAVIRSATKVLAIPGLRFGYGIVEESWAAQVNANRDGWSVNSIAQAAAVAGYQDQEFFWRTHRWLMQELNFVRQHWGSDDRLGLYEPHANFFLIRMTTPDIAAFVQEQLARQGLFLRSCDNFTGLGPEFLRIAVRSGEDNQRLWALVSQLLDRLL